MRRSATIPRTRSAVAFPWLRPLLQVIVRLRLFWIIVLAVLMLSGCVRYDASVTFHSPTRGEIVQHIQLNSSLTALNGNTAEAWFASLEQRAKPLEGKVQRLSAQDATITIPFYNGADLVTRFNQFFEMTSEAESAAGDAPSTLPDLTSHLALKQSNLLLVQRNHLTYDLDLRSLGVRATDGRLIASPASLVNLEFTLQAPLGAKPIGSSVPVKQAGNQLTWTLQPGQVNHLEAIVWLPDPLGIGTLAIALLCGTGFYLKYRGQAADAPTSPATAD